MKYGIMVVRFLQKNEKMGFSYGNDIKPFF